MKRQQPIFVVPVIGIVDRCTADYNPEMSVSREYRLLGFLGRGNAVAMIELQQQTTPREKTVFSILHGILGGVLGVIAVAVWAVNFEAVLSGTTSCGFFGILARLILCEAIPLATLCAIHSGVGSNQSTESTLRRLINRLGYYLGGCVLQRIVGNRGTT